MGEIPVNYERAPEKKKVNEYAQWDNMLSNRQRVKLSLDLKSENKLILPKKLQANPALTTSMPSEQQATSNKRTNKQNKNWK